VLWPALHAFANLIVPARDAATDGDAAMADEPMPVDPALFLSMTATGDCEVIPAAEVEQVEAEEKERDR